MQPKVNVITLGVKEMEKSRQFYEKGLGWPISSVSNEHISVFQLHGIVLCLYPEDSLAADAMAEKSEKGFKGITLAYNVSSKQEVDDVIKQAVDAGAKLIKPAQDVFWGGYSGYFADPSGHYWEVAWNPYWALQPDGTIQLP